MFKQAVFAMALFFGVVQFNFGTAIAQDQESYQVNQALGVDPRVDYQALQKFGPWDDRNYQLRKEDVALLPSDDQYISSVPAWFKIERRKKAIAHGTPLLDLYPRETNKVFYHYHNGLLRNGIFYKRAGSKGLQPVPKADNKPILWATDPLPKAAPLIGEGPFDTTVSDNETNVTFHPSNPLLVIAGSNGDNGQHQSFSSDGGATWSSSGALPSSCCDPSMDWSPSGDIAYTSTLTFGGGDIQVDHYWSFNNGANWLGPFLVAPPAPNNDKQFFHVDQSSASPFSGRGYMTWHNGNVLQFRAMTAAPIQAPATPPVWGATTVMSLPGGTETGIGSDIATDNAGRVYYVWPGLRTGAAGTNKIFLRRSDDGGATWNPAIGTAARQIYSLNGRFDMPIPAMEDRQAFIYVSVDVDRTSGPHAGRVYVAFTDESPVSPSGGSCAEANCHSWVRVIFSDDQGLTWSAGTSPHTTTDNATVDRFHPWLDVDGFGNVHIAFYDTRNSGAGLRDKTDFYYAYSADGGLTWIEETRVSQATSPNMTDGQEWGDYNGLDTAALGARVGMTWTDNRPPAATAAAQSFFARVENLGAGPTYQLSDGTNAAVCAGQPVPQQTFTLTAVNGYTGSVTLTNPGINAAVFSGANFSVNPVVPTIAGATTNFNVNTLVGAAAGSYTIDVTGTDATLPLPIIRSKTFNVLVASGIPATPTLTTPPDAASGLAVTPTLSWGSVIGATSYFVEVATDNAFTNVVASGTTTTTSFTVAAPLNLGTTYFWRVRAISPCDTGAFSAPRSFTTTLEICTTTPLIIPDSPAVAVTQDLVVGQTGILSDLNLRILGTHSWVGDLVVTLRKGAGTPVSMMSRPGGSGGGGATGGCHANGPDITLDDEATTSVETACTGLASAVTFTGTHDPDVALSAFDGQEFSGTWTISVEDDAGFDTGQFTRWCLDGVSGPTAPDLVVQKTGPANQFAGNGITYTIVVTNTGNTAATSFTLGDVVDANITGVTASCVAAGTATCGTNASAGNNVSFTGAAITNGVANTLTYTITGTVAAAFTGSLNNSAAVSTIVPADSDALDNTGSTSATVTIPPVGIFLHGFEDP